ncbi:MAG: hypothetical protein EHM26_06390, partial [Desulfobacteraceae bacterium]
MSVSLRGPGKPLKNQNTEPPKRSAMVLNLSETLSSPLATMQTPSFPGSKQPTPETPASMPASSFTSKKPTTPMTSTWPFTMPSVTKPLMPRPSNESSWQKPNPGPWNPFETNRPEKSWRKHCPASSNVPSMSIAPYFTGRRKRMAKTQSTQEQTLTQVRTYLNTLKLRKMGKALDEELSYGTRENLPVSKILERLLAIEADALIERRIERKIKDSRLPERKLLSDFDFAFQKSIDQHQIMDMATLSFVERKQGLILAGSSGTGKSHIAKALLLIGCTKLYRCRYTTAANMLKDLLASLADGTLEQKLKLYTRPDILLIDEVGFDRLEQESARNASLFFKVIDQRYCKAS